MLKDNGNYKKAIDITPNDPNLWNQVGVVYTELRYVGKALESYQHAISLKAIDLTFDKMGNPGILDEQTNFLLASIYMNMGLAHCYECEFVKGIECYNKALKFKPDLSLAFQNKLLDMNYISHLIPDKMYISNMHKKINKIYPKVITDYHESIPNYKVKNLTCEKIRIGFISGDYISHPVSYFISGILQSFDESKFEFYCYSMKIVNMENLYPKCNWFIIKNLSKEKLFEFISNHNVDILFDMSGQTGDNRLDLFALKPAPIQISYCGYPGTTGLNSIDYHITDKICDNEETQKYYSEKLIFMNHCFLNYNPPLESPPDFPEMLIQPFCKNGYITFGSFNRLNKLNKELLNFWETILEAIPNARFVIKTKEFLTPHLLEKYKNHFKNKSILDRVIILNYADGLVEHFQDYNLMDIALDSFPYSGTTTSCEALYMGVPIISLFDNEKHFHCQNVTSSLLINSDLKEYVCYSKEEYLNKAIELSKKDFGFFENLKKNTREKFVNNGHAYRNSEFYSEFQEKMIDIYSSFSKKERKNRTT